MDFYYASKTGIIIISTILAFIPIFMWGYHFLKKHPEVKKYVLITFIGGALSVTPLLLYKYMWNFFPWINAFVWTRNLNVDFLGLSTIMLVPFSVLVTFLLVGVVEEVSKMFAVKIVDKPLFRSVDDAIEFAIIAGLGFAFIENAIYFNNIIVNRGFEDLMFPFVFRSLFSTFAHVMFSGIFGYFYGVAHFADPILKKEMREKRHPIIKFFHKHFHFKRKVMFHDEKVLEGLVVASVLHAMFNVFLEMEWIFAIVPFLFIGYMILSSLLEKKENMKIYKKLLPVRTSGK
ncbi:PrsW family intramembrane metalloprotease [Patescibacteria group bacterium]